MDVSLKEQQQWQTRARICTWNNEHFESANACVDANKSTIEFESYSLCMRV